MAIFKLDKNKLTSIDEVKIDLEKDLQEITEENLQSVFGLKFISSEFALQGFRIDTLAFDEETQSFVIIEYKRDRSFSVVDQGFSYLASLLNNKNSFILEFARKCKINIDDIKIDWSQSRVLFLANSFTVHQQNAINFKDLPIELWEVKKYNNNTILFNKLKSSDGCESINKISKNKTIEKISKEVKKRSVEDHFKSDWEQSRALFEIVREKILELDERIIENPNPIDYIGYKINNANACGMHIYKTKLRIDLVRVDVEDLRDPEKKINKVPWRERRWPKMCSYEISSEEDVDYGIFLLKQVINKIYK